MKRGIKHTPFEAFGIAAAVMIFTLFTIAGCSNMITELTKKDTDLDAEPVLIALTDGGMVTLTATDGTNSGTITGTALDMDSDGTVDGIDLDDEATTAEMELAETGTAGIYSVDVNGDSTTDFYLFFHDTGTGTMNTSADGSGTSVTVVTDESGAAAGFDSTGDGTADTDLATGGSSGGGGTSAAGTLDTTFDTDGIVVHHNAAGGSGSDRGESIAIDANGKIVVAGQSYAVGGIDLAIWRYNDDGTLDTSFGTAGIVTWDSGGNDFPWGLAIDSSGRITVAGNAPNPGDPTDFDLYIWRFTDAGALDTSFGGGDGIVFQNNTDIDEMNNMMIDDSGNILVTGRIQPTAGDWDMALWRFTSDGSLDTGFGSGNGYVTSSGTNSSEAWDIAVDSDGKVLVVGQDNSGADNNMAIWRFLDDGTPDSSFDGDGITYYNNGSYGVMGYSVAIQTDGTILVAGYKGNDAGDNDMAIWKYNNNGSPDLTFGDSGVAVYDGGVSENEYGRSIAIDPNGKILVTGDSFGTSTDMGLWRYNRDGTLDTTFGDGDGLLVHNGAAGGSGYDSGRSMVLDGDGKILITGVSDTTVSSYNFDMVIWRYE